MKKKILFMSGSVGLGHITRDLQVAVELRRLNPGIEILWLAAHPASLFLKGNGEKLHPEACSYKNFSFLAEKSAEGFQLNLAKYMFSLRKRWVHNRDIFRRLVTEEQFDLVIGDEAYEAFFSLRERGLEKLPFVMIYDFLGLDPMMKNPLERLAVYYLNWKWAKDYRILSSGKRLVLFAGEPDGIPHKRFGFLLPDRRNYALKYYRFTGNILPFDPIKYTDKERVRKKLGYGGEPLVVGSIGGTSIGKGLLELCGKAYPIIRKVIPNLRMILVSGPRLFPSSLKVPHGVEVRGYVPSLYEHFAACDLAIVQGGATTTLELAALRIPFLYFPLQGHSEQEIHVAGFLNKLGAGVRMSYSKTTPQILAETVISHISKVVTWEPIKADGAKIAAQLIHEILKFLYKNP